MNLVKTYIDKSPIQGIGLFAGEDIPIGTVMWKLTEFDMVINDFNFTEACKTLTDEQVKYLKRYIYFNNGKWIYCADDAKFTNHSRNPNTLVTFDRQVSIKDIKIGEEITCNYHHLDKDFTEEEFNQD